MIIISLPINMPPTCSPHKLIHVQTIRQEDNFMTTENSILIQSFNESRHLSTQKITPN